MGPAELEEVGPGNETFVVVVGHASWFDVDDLGQTGKGAVRLEHLVVLLLVLGEVHERAAVGDQILDLGRRIRRVQTDGDATNGDGGQIEDHPFGPILGMDRHPVTHIDPEGQQPVGRSLDQLPHLGPGVLVPDPVVLLPHGHALGRGSRPSPRQRRDRGRAGFGARRSRFQQRHWWVPLDTHNGSEFETLAACLARRTTRLCDGRFDLGV